MNVWNPAWQKTRTVLCFVIPNKYFVLFYFRRYGTGCFLLANIGQKVCGVIYYMQIVDLLVFYP